MFKQEFIASICCVIVRIFVRWLPNGCLAEACMPNNYARYVQPSVMLVQRSVRNSKTRIAKIVQMLAENVLTNAAECLHNRIKC
ncbi:hypothetical protein GCM10027018_25210 [Paenibacillus thermoaerophilus]